MGKFFKQAFDMSNGTPNPDEVKYEMTKQAKDAFEKHEERLELAVKRGAEGRKEHSKVINEMKEDILAHERLADKYSQSVDKQLMQIRKDYRELQQEVLDDLSVIKGWIIATSHSDKEKIRVELERYKKIEKGKLTTGMILGSSASLTPNVPGNRPERKENPKNKSLACSLFRNKVTISLREVVLGLLQPLHPVLCIQINLRLVKMIPNDSSCPKTWG